MNLMPFQELPFNGDSFICREFLKLKEQHGLTVAVETGSCLFSTTKWLGDNFHRVHTVEINEEFAKHGRHKVEGMINVFPEIDDSIMFLKKLMTMISSQDRVIYFLDAHWGQHCPLIGELDALKQSPTVLPPVIAIHDWYTGDERLGYDEYNGQRFDYAWIQPKVKELEEQFECTYTHYFNTEAENGMRGVIYLIPNISWVNSIKKAKWSKYSQTGEEGYIDHILCKMPNKGSHLVELGAWDGFHLSNTRYFIERGFSHLLIDGDNRGNEEVKTHFINKENIIDILKNYNTPQEFDLLCVDIDGNDLYIIDEILSEYKPSLIVAEFNPIFAHNESKAIEYNPFHTWMNNDYYGFSFLAGIKMAEKHGYVCVHQNDNLNMYFVRKEFVEVVPNITYQQTFYHPAGIGKWVDY